MKQLLVTLILFAASMLYVFPQVPQMFSYQAAIRDVDGSILADEDIDIKIILRKASTDGESVYEEAHSITTNSQGVISISVGGGESTVGDFASIPWSESIFLQVDVKKSGETDFNTMGVSQILSVPYALYAGNAIQGDGTIGQTIVFDGNYWIPTNRIAIDDNTVQVVTQEGRSVEEPIFAVRNSNNEIVFAVYESGARVYVAEQVEQKSTRGGFAVGGLSDQNKQDAPNYLTILPDQVQFNILQPTDAKSTRGGFAVGGLSDQNKTPTHNYFTLKSDSVRFQLDNDPVKGTRGGFAVGGLSDQNKSVVDYLMVNSDSTYVMNTLSALGNVLIQGDMLTGGTVGTLPIVDIDGNKYQTVKIGNQVWMKENLKSLKGGTLIASIDYVTYNSDVAFLPDYGYLYTYEPVISPEEGLCPTGWRVPAWMDWEELFAAVAGLNWGENAAILAARLMEVSDLWVTPAITPTNLSGFSARPGGSGNLITAVWNYSGEGQYAYFWSAYGSSGDPEVIVIDAADGWVNVQPASVLNDQAYSIRCIQNPTDWVTK